MKKFILSLCMVVFLSSCDVLDEFNEQSFAAFNDQHFKTSIAPIELHKVRFGQYPQTLLDLKYVGDWDAMAISSVSYTKSSTESGDGYYLYVKPAMGGEVKLDYPDEFWNGLGIINKNKFSR